MSHVDIFVPPFSIALTGLNICEPYHPYGVREFMYHNFCISIPGKVTLKLALLNIANYLIVPSG